MTYTNSTVEVVISVGSNCGDRYKNVEECIRRINPLFDKFRSSHIYATPDCHGGVRNYMNAVVVGYTSIGQQELELVFKDIEKEMGRDEKARIAGDVPIDIDVVVYDRQILRESDYRREFFKIGFAELF